MFKKGVLVSFLLIFCLSTVFVVQKLFHMKKISSTKADTIFIFIHGTILPAPMENMKGLSQVLISKGFYQGYLDSLRDNSFYKKQPIGLKGLHKIDSNTNKYSKDLISHFKNVYLKVYAFSTNENIHFYTFGWDGKLSRINRKKSADLLYEQIWEEIAKINSSKSVKIILLSHSHGGNVALNLAKSEEKYKKGLQIQKLILFGTPIQAETKGLIKTDTFCKIYNFYSTGDFVQTADFISTKGILSKRKLPNYKDKVVNIKTTVSDVKPGHCEFWFDGHIGLYRKNLKLYPYPIFIFIPIVINILDSLNPKADKNLLMDLEKNGDNLQILLKTKNNKALGYKNFKF